MDPSADPILRGLTRRTLYYFPSPPFMGLATEAVVGSPQNLYSGEEEEEGGNSISAGLGREERGKVVVAAVAAGRLAGLAQAAALRAAFSSVSPPLPGKVGHASSNTAVEAAAAAGRASDSQCNYKVVNVRAKGRASERPTLR